MADEADRADDKIEAERAAGVAAVVYAVAGRGRRDCETCADEIEEARRRAMPSARKCHACQEAAERRARQYRAG